jgi:cell division protein FtsL
MAVAAPARTRRAIPRKAAPARIPPADRRASGPRRHLQVVTDARVTAVRRRRRLRGMLVLLGIAMVLSLFALAAFHAMLASEQASLDRLEERVGDAQARYERLRLDVAELEAPSRIVREAQERLGMVPPEDVTYLTPSEAVSAQVGQGAAVDSPSTSDEAGERAPWATVKPYFGGRP